MANTTLYSQDLPKIILLKDVYDPDVDFGSIENTSKIIPAVGSLLIDGSKVYVVRAVDAVTYKTTYESISIEQSLDLKRVLEYGNTFYSLFFAKTQITDYSGAKINLTRLSVDDKLTFYGDHITNYDIVKITDEGKEVVVSRYFDSSMKPKGTTCPVSGATDNKKCVPCYSYEEFKAGKQYVVRAFDSAGNLVARFQLVTVPASILTDLYSETNPIVGIEVTSNQIDSEGKIFLYQNQNVSELTIYVQLKYEDGSKILVAVDNQVCFLYGKEEIKTKNLGSWPLTVKYFLAKDEASIVNDGVCDNRFITKEFEVEVRTYEAVKITKLSIIPKYNVSSASWSLRVMAYLENREQAPLSIGNATFTGWSGTLFNTKQEVTASVSITNVDGTVTKVDQKFFIEVRKPSENSDNPFLLSDTADQAHVFGDDTVDKGFIAPRLWYGKFNDTLTGYFIPKNKYTATAQYATAVDNFLSQFYYAINPPKLGTETTVPVPTHFTIRNPETGSTLLSVPFALEDFESFMDLAWSMAATEHRASTLVVEFWSKKATEDDYEILFGVPVYVADGNNE